MDTPIRKYPDGQLVNVFNAAGEVVVREEHVLDALWYESGDVAFAVDPLGRYVLVSVREPFWAYKVSTLQQMAPEKLLRPIDDHGRRVSPPSRAMTA